MNSKPASKKSSTLAHTFEKSAKSLFRSIGKSSAKASRASEKVYVLAKKCSDPVLAAKLYALSDALHAQRHVINFWKLSLTESRPSITAEMAKHSKEVGLNLSRAGILSLQP